MTQDIVLVIIDAMISNDSNIGIMDESKKSMYKYCLIVNIENGVKLYAEGFLQLTTTRKVAPSRIIGVMKEFSEIDENTMNLI